jgi:hypothetical protein
MTDATTRANDLLKRIREARKALEEKRDQIDRMIREIRDTHGPESQALKAEVNGLEKDLVKLMKKNKATFFKDTDQVDLDEGTLLHGFDDKVTIPKNAAAEIERFGWTEALRYADPTVDRATVEKWPEERLAAIGATRKHNVEVFEYEVKEEPS